MSYLDAASNFRLQFCWNSLKQTVNKNKYMTHEYAVSIFSASSFNLLFPKDDELDTYSLSGE